MTGISAMGLNLKINDMEEKEKSKTGLVIYQDPEFWLKIEQKVLDLKKHGVHKTKAQLGAEYMQIGYLKETVR